MRLERIFCASTRQVKVLQEIPREAGMGSNSAASCVDVDHSKSTIISPIILAPLSPACVYESVIASASQV